MVSGYDVFIALVLAFCFWRGYRRGLVRMIFGLASVFLAVWLASILHPMVYNGLIHTPIAWTLQDWVSDTLGISGLVAQGVTAQSEAIDSLPLPEAMRTMILANNNPAMHDILGVSALEEFIAVYVTSLILRIVSAILVFVVVSMVMGSLSRKLRLVNRIPIIGKANRAGGAAVGVAGGTLMVWAVLSFIAFAESATDTAHLPPSLEGTIIAAFFHHNNLILNILTDFL